MHICGVMVNVYISVTSYFMQKNDKHESERTTKAFIFSMIKQCNELDTNEIISDIDMKKI